MKPIFRIAEDTLYSVSFLPIGSRMYILLRGDKALVIDPCSSLEAQELLDGHGVKNVLVLLTHEHFDHISGVDFFRERFACHVLCSESCARAIIHPRKNLSQYFTLLLGMNGDAMQRTCTQMDIVPFGCQADETFYTSKEFVWSRHNIRLIETPGHSDGSICITIDGCALFTGDSLTNGNPAVTRLPGGSRQKYTQVTLPYLCSLDGQLQVFPGHGDPERLRILIEQEVKNASQR